MRRAFFFIGVFLFAATSFASIPRVSVLDDAPALSHSLPGTRLGVSEVLAPFERPAESELTRALRQACGELSTTNASGSVRFLSVDPKMPARLQVPQSWNRYSYAWNNPLKFVDPDGEDVMLVVRDSGAGRTNFGHVAIRVFGKGYDRTYDFGRYGKTWGLMKSQGEGILKVWSNPQTSDP